MTTAEKIADLIPSGLSRYFTHSEAKSLGVPFNVGMGFKSYIFADKSIVEFGPVVRAMPF